MLILLPDPCIFVTRMIPPMNRLTITGWTYTRHISGTRSICVTYPRTADPTSITAGLSNFNQSAREEKLAVLHADQQGVQIELPEWISGLFTLTIRDGEQSFERRLAIQ